VGVELWGRKYARGECTLTRERTAPAPGPPSLRRRRRRRRSRRRCLPARMGGGEWGAN